MITGIILLLTIAMGAVAQYRSLQIERYGFARTYRNVQQQRGVWSTREQERESV